tara:strand:- start:7714 stop:8700 length:987 start_codon:yes stop_codon:yes gene_type:complete
VLNVGILGFGYMGEIRKNFLDSDPSFNVKSIFHIEKISGDFEYVDNIDAIIYDENIDVIFVCLPNFLIKSAVIKSLETGKHVFAEKPPGISSEEVEKMIEAEKRSRKILKFGFNHRWHPAIMKAKDLVDSNELGKILWMRGRYGKSVEPEFDKGWRSKKEFAGGGILMDQGIHMLDLLLYFAGDFENAKAYASNLYWKGDIEDNVFAIMRNTKGQVASLHSTMTQWRYLFALEIFLSKGYIVINGLLSKSGRYGQEKLSYGLNESPSPMAVHSEMQSITFNTDLSWKFEIDEFLNAINSGESVKIGNSQDALKLMELIEKIYANAALE